MKKHLVFILCIISLISVFAVALAAGTNITSTSSANEVKTGNTFTITVSMNKTTITSLGATVTTDDAFEVQSAEWLKQGLIANFDKSKNKGAFAAGGASEISGDIFKVTLKAKSAGASSKDVKVEIIAKNGTSVLWTESVSHKIKVVCSSHTFGDYTKTNTKHERTCSSCGYVEFGNHTMDNGKVTTEATCTKEGVLTKTCSVCKYTTTSSIAKKAHNYGAWTKISDTEHEHKCTCGATEKANHNWSSWKTTIEATCSKEGTKTSTCTDCKATKTNVIAKKTHTYTNACDEECNVCKEIRNTTHKYSSTWDSDTKNHWHTCSVCKGKEDVMPHISTGWIIDKEPATLSAGSQHKECAVCKRVLQTESIPALDCNHIEGTKISGVKEVSCTIDGYTGDSVCKICNTVLRKGDIIEAPGHQLEIVNFKESSCIENGYTGDEKCRNCNQIIKHGEVTAKGEHDFDISEAKDATCTHEGSTGKMTCRVCGTIVEGNVINKLPHEYKDGLCIVCGEKEPTSTPSTADPTTEPILEPTEASTTEPIKTSKPTQTATPKPIEPDKSNSSLWIVIVCAAVAIGIVVVLVVKRKKH